MQGGKTVDQRFDVLIIGAGVVGSAAARELARYQLKIGVLEKTPDVCCGTCAHGCPGGTIPDPKDEKARITVDFGERQIYYGDV